MAPGEDVERGRASSAAERQKSIVSMTEFEGMDEYTALQKYILFYRDPRSAGHQAEEAPKKKRWWQSNAGQGPVADLAAEVPDECMYSTICTSITSTAIPSMLGCKLCELHHHRTNRLSILPRAHKHINVCCKLQMASFSSLSLELAPAAVDLHHVRTTSCRASRSTATPLQSSRFCATMRNIC